MVHALSCFRSDARELASLPCLVSRQIGSVIGPHPSGQLRWERQPMVSRDQDQKSERSATLLGVKTLDYFTCTEFPISKPNADRGERPIEADIFRFARIDAAIHRIEEQIGAIA